MHIVTLGWLYVVALMALAEHTITAGLLTLVFYGLAPLALFLWLAGTPRRRRARRTEGPSSKASAVDVGNQSFHKDDGADAQADHERLLEGRAEFGTPMQTRDEVGDGDVDHARRR